LPNTFYMLIDIHRHSTDNGEADLILRNAFHNEPVNELNGKYFSVGLHPWHVKEHSLNEDINLVADRAKYKKVIAIGEAGIDKTIDTAYQLQLKAFTQQIEIAKEYQLPMIIHCVKAYSELLSLKKNSKHKQPWIIHWFNASTEMALDLIKKNCYLSFGNILFKENTKGYKAFLKIPIEYIFLETDDIDIPLTKIYEKAAELKCISLAGLQNQIKENFKNCFEISL
jgi:TatD DNase family protein